MMKKFLFFWLNFILQIVPKYIKYVHFSPEIVPIYLSPSSSYVLNY